MVTSSRMQEGELHRCPVRGKPAVVEPSFPSGDSCRPSCGHLLWWFRDRLSRGKGITPEEVVLSSTLVEDIGVDSLDIAELVMTLEEEFGIVIPDEEAGRIRTVEDAIRYIEQHRPGEPPQAVCATSVVVCRQPGS